MVRLITEKRCVTEKYSKVKIPVVQHITTYQAISATAELVFLICCRWFNANKDLNLQKRPNQAHQCYCMLNGIGLLSNKRTGEWTVFRAMLILHTVDRANFSRHWQRQEMVFQTPSTPLPPPTKKTVAQYVVIITVTI